MFKLFQAGQSTSCKVVVYVVDYNDNRPTFTQESYSGFIQESAIPGSIIMTEDGPLRVFAEDLDSGVNGVLDFTIQEGPAQDLLTIDPITGRFGRFECSVSFGDMILNKGPFN